MAKLLPSGRYVLFNNWNKLECWNVADDRLIWKHTSPIEHASVLDFGAEQVEDSAIVMICVRTYPHGYHAARKNYVQVVRVDLQTGTQSHLFVGRAPDTDYDNPFSLPTIRGALAVVTTNSEPDRHMIVNWRAQSYFILQCKEESPSMIALIEQHVVLRTSSLEDEGEDGEEQTQLHIISNDALRAYWAPAFAIDGPVEFAVALVEDIPKLSTFVDTDLDQSFGYMSVLESPLQDGAYRVWLHGSIYSADNRRLCYQLSIPVGGEPQWRRRCQASELAASLIHTVPYFGHTLFHSISGGYTISPPISSSEFVRVELSSAGDHLDVAPYSGAITYSTRTSIVIQYYK